MQCCVGLGGVSTDEVFGEVIQQVNARGVVLHAFHAWHARHTWHASESNEASHTSHAWRHAWDSPKTCTGSSTTATLASCPSSSSCWLLRIIFLYLLEVLEHLIAGGKEGVLHVWVLLVKVTHALHAFLEQFGCLGHVCLIHGQLAEVNIASQTKIILD